jgi:metal-responsive CopG/Arc/MetJ family transcriptional regulator
MRKPKAIRAYSLDLEVITMLEKFAAAHDTWGKKKSRSKIVNDAIRYHITGGYADKLDSLESLQANFTRVCQEKADLEEKLRRETRFELN